MPQAPYSFLAIVLEGFAEEPVPHWREKCEVSDPKENPLCSSSKC